MSNESNNDADYETSTFTSIDATVVDEGEISLDATVVDEGEISLISSSQTVQAPAETSVELIESSPLTNPSPILSSEAQDLSII